MGKLLKKILNKRGETILEAVASLLVFVILMLAISTMISASLKITGNSNQSYRQFQEHMKTVVNEESYTIPDSITFDIGGKLYPQEINGTAEKGIIAFAPVETTVPTP